MVLFFTNEDKFLFEQFIKHWGIEAQINMLIEEMGELLTAINKYRRKPYWRTLKALEGELADVQLMLEQVIFHYGLDKIRKIRDEKLKRTEIKLRKSVVLPQKYVWGLNER